MRDGPPVVAFDATPLVARRTGIGYWLGELTAALSARGVPLRPWVLSLRGALPEGGRRLPVPAGAAVRWWSRHDRPRLDRWFRDAAVVHGTNFVAPPVRRPLLLTVHDLTFHRFPELCTPDTLAYGALVRRAVARGAWVHTHTEAVAAEIREELGASLVRVVAPGVPALPAPGPDPVEGPYVLVLGTMEPRKRPQLAVDVFAEVAGAHPGLTLVLAGADGGARPTVPPTLAGRVRMLGPVDDATRSALYHGARAVLHTAVYEGFGFPVLEAMAAGTPVVAVPNGAVEEAAGGAAALAAPGELAAALHSVLADEERRRTMAEAGRSRVAAFSWDGAAAGMAALYEEVGGA